MSLAGKVVLKEYAPLEDEDVEVFPIDMFALDMDVPFESLTKPDIFEVIREPVISSYNVKFL